MQICLHSFGRYLLWVAPALFPAMLHAQVFEISAGRSTAFDATGGTVLIHTEHTETSIGAGYSNGRFGASASLQRPFRDGVLRTGSVQFNFDTLTDPVEEAHALLATGADYFSTDRASGRFLRLFVGTATHDGGSPLFRTTEPFGFLLYGESGRRLQGTLPGTMPGIWSGLLRRPARMLSGCTARTNGLVFVSRASRAFTALQGVACSPTKHLHLAATAGIAGLTPYAAVAANLNTRRLDFRASYYLAHGEFFRGTTELGPQPEPVRENLALDYKPARFFTISGLHTHYALAEDAGQTATASQEVVHSTIDQISFQYHLRGGGVSIGALKSSFSSDLPLAASAGVTSGASRGLTLVAEKTAGRVDLSGTVLASESSAGRNLITLGTLGLRLNSHVRLAETAGSSNGQFTTSHGGDLNTTFSSFHVEYQTVYLPLTPATPFEQAMLMEADVRVLPRVHLHVSSGLSANGKTLYTFSLSSLVAHQSATAESVFGGRIGSRIIQGDVVDTEGKPVEGAALMIGRTRLYTAGDGSFQLRQQRAGALPLLVLTGEFLDGGAYAVIAAPPEVTPERQPVLRHIVVARRPGRAIAGQAVAPADSHPNHPRSHSVEAPQDFHINTLPSHLP